MKYSTIQISSVSGKWTISHSDLPYDRKVIEPQPSPLGYYHYPTKQDKQTAFELLKQCMIKRHEDEIEKLKKSLKSLQELKF